MYGKRVRQARRLQIHVEAAIQVRCGPPVDAPVALSIGFELHLVVAAARTARRTRALRDRAIVEVDRVVDRPGIAGFDRRAIALRAPVG